MIRRSPTLPVVPEREARIDAFLRWEEAKRELAAAQAVVEIAWANFRSAETAEWRAQQAVLNRKREA